MNMVIIRDIKSNRIDAKFREVYLLKFFIIHIKNDII